MYWTNGIRNNEQNISWVWETVLEYRYFNYYKELFTHKDINTYINGVV